MKRETEIINWSRCKNIMSVILFSLITIFLFSCNTQIESTDFTKPGSFTDGIEGPATDVNGNLYAVNFEEQGTIGKVTPDGETSIFAELPNGSIGNGIRFGAKEQMFIADYTNHNILEVNLQTKEIQIFAHEDSANQPNDIAIAPNQILYASDPNWAEEKGKIWKVTRENGFELLEDNMGTTNGVEVSPDGKKLYVNESVQRNIWVYDIVDGGGISNKKLFSSFDDFGCDGMRCDKEGNLYVCRYGKGSIVVYSPEAVILKEIKLKGEKPSNITFSPDYKIAYITMADRGCIELIKIK